MSTTLIKRLLAAEVRPAMGCTEAAAAALAGAIAGQTGTVTDPAQVKHIRLRVDAGTFKNGNSVLVPNCGGERGLTIAVCVGIMMGVKLDPADVDLQILLNVRSEDLERAKAVLSRLEVVIVKEWNGFRIEVEVEADHTVFVTLDEYHENVISVTLDGTPQAVPEADRPDSDHSYRDEVGRMTLADMVALAKTIDHDDREFIRSGLAMNRLCWESGMKRSTGVGNHLRWLMNSNVFEQGDPGLGAEMRVAAAADGRMGGSPQRAMSSGGSGNQGFVAIVVPAHIGVCWGIDPLRIDEAVTLSHILNVYCHVHIGELSSMCGCAVAAGIGAAAGVAYLQTDDVAVVDAAVRTLIGMIGGVVCDGAHEGCALKVAASAQLSSQAALLAIDGYMPSTNGIGAMTATEAIRNMGEVAHASVAVIDATVLQIVQRRGAERRCC